MAAALVLLLAIAGGVFLALKRDLVLVLMDTTAANGIYDEDNRATGASNASEVDKALQGHLPPGTRLHPEPLSAEWMSENAVTSLRPDLVVIHRSSFFHSYNAIFNFGLKTNGFATPAQDPKWEFLYNFVGDDKLITVLGRIGNEVPHARFLIYSRGTDTNWLSGDFRHEWVKKIEVRFPKLKGRVNTMVIPNGYSGSFRESETRALLRSNVIEILKLPKKPN